MDDEEDQQLGYSVEARFGLLQSIQQTEAEQIEKAWAAERAARRALAAAQDPRAVDLEALVKAREAEVEVGDAQLEKFAKEIEEREAKRKAELAALKKVPFPPMPAGE